MYKNISLLPAVLKKEEALKKKWSIASGIMTVIAVCFIGLYLLSTILVDAPEIELKSLETKNSQLNKQISENIHYEEAYSKAVNNIKIANAVLEGQPHWPSFIETVLKDIPYNVWITNIKFDNVSEQPFCQIEADANTKEEMVGWLDKLNQNKYLEEVRCKNTTVDEANEKISFTIYAFLKVEQGE